MAFCHQTWHDGTLEQNLSKALKIFADVIKGFSVSFKVEIGDSYLLSNFAEIWHIGQIMAWALILNMNLKVPKEIRFEREKDHFFRKPVNFGQKLPIKSTAMATSLVIVD